VVGLVIVDSPPGAPPGAQRTYLLAVDDDHHNLIQPPNSMIQLLFFIFEMNLDSISHFCENWEFASVFYGARVGFDREPKGFVHFSPFGNSELKEG
jgi:hypothetical protein